MTFLSNPIVVVLLVALIVIGGLFVLSRFGSLGSGPGGVTGAPKTGRKPVPPPPTGGSGPKNPL